jgi:hypothetical protein
MAAKSKSGRSKRFNKIDEEVEETFPASDPPSFMNGIIGAPPGRKTKNTKAAKRPPAKKKAARKTAKKRK